MKESQNDDIQPVINLDQFRNRKSEEKKRKTERLFFHNLVGVYGIVQPGKMLPVDLIDVSEEGLAIQVPYPTSVASKEQAWPRDSENVSLRLYFSPDSFMEVVVDVKNSRPTIENGSKYVRYGCAVNSGHRSYAAWKNFVIFLRAYTDVSERDSGNINVGNF